MPLSIPAFRHAKPRAAPAAGRLPYALSIEGCRSEVIGTAGLTPAKLELWLRRGEPHLARLRVQYEDGSLPLLRIARAAEEPVTLNFVNAEIEAVAHQLVTPQRLPNPKLVGKSASHIAHPYFACKA